MHRLGATPLPNNRCHFRVWAPLSQEVHLHLLAPHERLERMTARAAGYYDLTVENAVPGTRYRYRLDSGGEFPDPASSFQPEGVFGPSAVVAPDFGEDEGGWSGLPLERFILYEIHVGTFTREGTFDAIIPHLDDLADLGVTAIELMPVAQFPGGRNWGYDGVLPFAVQNTYGGPEGLRRLVAACHRRGMAVALDVVYNHLGPEGNFLPKFGPYFTDRYKTPWGPAINFDDAHSDEVRAFFIENAVRWIREYHIDALRLDAVHAIMDHSAVNFLEELAEHVHEEGARQNRRVYVIAESSLNDTRLIRPRELGGYGLDAQWNDDFHHALHTLLTRECNGYYVDFGRFEQLGRAFSEGFVYSGQPSRYRGRRHGRSSKEIPASKFVVYAQNHDQIGNRMMGERLSRLVSRESFKLAQCAVLLAPFIPLLFMGDEYGEPAPFQYFVSHSDPQLAEAVRRGRMQEFAKFHWQGDPPDPQSSDVFEACRLHHDLRRRHPHQALFNFHRELIRLRTKIPALGHLSKEEMDVSCLEQLQILLVRRWRDASEVLIILNFNDGFVRLGQEMPAGTWRTLLDSSDPKWDGNGSALPSFLKTESGAALEIPPKTAVVLVRV